MAFVAKTFCDTFFESLRQRYETFTHDKVSPQFSWLNSALIFIALQTCRNEVRLDGRHEEPWSRFKLHPPTEKTNDPEGNEAAKAAYKLVREQREVRHNFDEVPEHVTEWLIDFSFSYRKIDEAYGIHEAPPAGDFELLLTAESEIDSSYDKVMEDLLRLFFIPSPVRVMIYHKRAEDFKQHFIRMLKAHGHRTEARAAHWLFLGIPTYRDWRAVKTEGNIRYKVHYLPAGANPDALETHDEWWDESGEHL